MLVFVITDYKGIVKKVVGSTKEVREHITQNITDKYKIKDLSEWVGLYKGDIT